MTSKTSSYTEAQMLASLREQEGVIVPLAFVQGFSTLAHNYSLQAVAPDYYHGVERDAFKSAYSRCGADLAKLRDMLAAAPKDAASPVPMASSAGEPQESVKVIRGIMEFIRLHAKPGGFDPALAEQRINARLDKIEAAFDAQRLGRGKDGAP